MAIKVDANFGPQLPMLQKLPVKIVHISTAMAAVGESLIRETIAVDELGRAWSLKKDRWEMLPGLPL